MKNSHQLQPFVNPNEDPFIQNSKVYSDAEINSIALLVSMILHTDKCTKLNERCDFEQCKFMKNLFAHMQFCSAGKLCPILLCSSVGYTINHWNNCDQSDCPVCSQFKKKPWRFKRTFVGDPTTVTYVKQELSWTFHALSCRNAQCPRLLCASTKSLLVHIKSCKEGRSCERFKCSPLRQILSHWENCHMLNCEICSSFRMVQLRSQLAG